MSFATIDVPGATATYAFGVNNAGEIVGQTSIEGQELGWLYDGSSFQTAQYPSAHNTSFGGINDSGVVAGYDEPNSSTPRYGFTLTGSTFATIDLSPYFSSGASGINDAGIVVGQSYLHTVSDVTPVYTGYIDDHGTVTYLNAPGTLTSSGYTAANGINNAGQVVGDYETTYGSNNQGFLYQNGVFTTIDDPDAGPKGTSAQGINDNGVIVGFFTDANNQQHGFIDNNGVFTTIDNPLGVNGTSLNGINDAG
jgi:probable HAF family extracellular repeat protein